MLGHFTSIFLRPFAPPELPGFHATTDALTSERRLFLPVGSREGVRHMNTFLPVQISLLNVVESSDHSVSNHLLPPLNPWFGFSDSGIPRGTAFQPPPSRRTLASLGLRLFPVGSPRTTGRIKFTFVTDWSFTSCCSPHRLAATQLRSVTVFKPNTDRDLHPAGSTRSQAH